MHVLHKKELIFTKVAKCPRHVRRLAYSVWWQKPHMLSSLVLWICLVGKCFWWSFKPTLVYCVVLLPPCAGCYVYATFTVHVLAVVWCLVSKQMLQRYIYAYTYNHIYMFLSRTPSNWMVYTQYPCWDQMLFRSQQLGEGVLIASPCVLIA